ncbi:MAG: hypothetical protein ABIE84_05020 [bacterium]
MSTNIKENLQEEKELTREDYLIKIQKLDVFIKRAERRIVSNEKKLERLRKELQNEVANMKKRLLV